MSTIKNLLENYEQLYFQELSLVKNDAELEAFRIKHLSRNGLLTTTMQSLKELPLEEKKVLGPLFNALKEKAQEAFKNAQEQLFQEEVSREAQKNKNFDVTAYKPFQQYGSLHPYTQVTETVEDILISMGFEIAQGPEVETDFYNFEALNIPADHPARDMQDTFWLTFPGFLMRTHTSSVQIHTLLKKKPPVAIAVPGRAYRNEATDASHDFMFMQLEGMLVDKDISLAHLTATLKTFLATFFEKKELSIQIRPSYFPFVEPGIEVDMTCPFCSVGCSVCKKTKWIEIGGAGLIHPRVLTMCSIDPSVYSGFAFGFGLTRLVMLKYGITDIRLLHSNKREFLKQF
jgi:phenylalanyl-tRNA synthetase alpha chain